MDIKIEKVTVADAQEILSIYAPYVTDTAVTYECQVPTVEEFEKRIKNFSSLYPYIKAVYGGRIVGYAYATKFRERKAYERNAEVTVYVQRDMKRLGIGSMLYAELEKSLRDMGILNMNAWVASTQHEDRYLNGDSIAFHEKMGFSKVGTFRSSGYKFGKWYDMTCMEKHIGEHVENPDEVRFGKWDI